jgi:hypothetical protein
VTNSQDPDIKSFKVTTEKQTAATATASATMLDRDGPRKFSADETVHYDFVWEDGQWKIDDIRGEMEGYALVGASNAGAVIKAVTAAEDGRRAYSIK